MALLWRAVHCIVPWLRRATSEKQYRYKGIEPWSPAEAQTVRAARCNNNIPTAASQDPSVLTADCPNYRNRSADPFDQSIML